MAGVQQSSGGASASINVVPLIDIVLVLLIIFMVVTPMLQKGVDVKLPPAQNVVSKDERTAKDLVITVKADRSIFYDTQELPKELLSQQLNVLHQTQPLIPIMVKGDERASFGDVRDVVIACQKAGFKTVNIATEAKKKASG